MVTLTYFLSWTRAMTAQYGDLSDIKRIKGIFNTFIHCGNLEIYEVQKL